jgi:hypothetical protein
MFARSRTRFTLLAQLAYGVFTYIAFLVRHRNGYLAENAFYRAAQDGHRGARALLTSAPAHLFVDFAYATDAATRDRIPPRVAATYAGDTLGGYGELNFDSGTPLREQQRGLLLPELEAAIDALGNSATVVEVGTANGDVAAHVASHFARARVVGVDLSVKTALTKHVGLENLTFSEGYALDMLEAGELQGDLVFASSTFCVFTPRELARYLAAIAAAGYTRVVLNEPTWAGYVQNVDARVFSRHLDGDVWHHNYAGYLAAAGFRTKDSRFFPFRHPRSTRPDIWVFVVSAEANSRI